MANVLAAAKSLVKCAGDDFLSHTWQAPGVERDDDEILDVEGLIARILEVYEEGKRAGEWTSEGDFSEKCGLARSHVGLIRRKTTKPNRATVKRIAERTKVRAAWLSDGELPKRPMRLTKNDRYPNRTKAAAAARQLDYDEQAIQDVLAEVLKSPTDPTPEAWLQMMKARSDLYRSGASTPPGHEPDPDV